MNTYHEPYLYIPSVIVKPPCLHYVTSAWQGLDHIIVALIRDFNLSTQKCLEFGVEFGYSTVFFSQFFRSVIGVDIFEGDIHTAHKGDHYEQTKQTLSHFKNINLIKSNYQDWIITDKSFYDFIHVDIIHTYEDTFACGLWSAQHSQCTIFHDTESFPEVKQAVHDIAKQTGKKFYNYPAYHGLGILVD